MSDENTTSPKLTINAPFASDNDASDSIPTPAEPNIPSFMTATPHLPQGYGEQIVETAESMAHIVPQAEEPAKTEPIVAPEIKDRSQPVFEQPQPVVETPVHEPVFDAPRHLEAAYADDTTAEGVIVAAASVATPIAAQPAPAHAPQSAMQPAQSHTPEPAADKQSRKSLPFLAAFSNIPPKYAYGGLAAAIALLSIGLFAIPMDDADLVQTAATTELDADGADLRNLASKVEVKQPLSAAATPSGSSLMRNVSEQIVTHLARLVPQDGLDAKNAQGDLAGLIAQAIATDQSDAVLRAIITDAINNNQLTVPGGLVNSEGEIDTATLVDALMQITAEGSAVDPDYELPPQRTNIDGDTLVHLVVSGESLASISLRYHGNTFDYPRIFAANTDKLASPDQIRVGQRLVIPQ